ncbi:SUA5/YciO/yrdC, N-terminal domain [Luminiphilus syltensis NOR5-1B]|uniref:Threonylcarbamoyl-AMP synthase n=1 Tax=Luminiphilus syltensis NOR5-1B TaxID=565045 RepID=B8KUG4_9GAMM|nr:Sua5/YciO/YrdC/YwlC family protein [Luminiphilus syltensis]EED35644.1 SUA5/YciO/yrdC, N-terminal domain [Luminiphilus syltensis NOR5-1B]
MPAQTFNSLLIAERILLGDVVACAAEGVWGLSCDPFDGDAVEQVLALKGRSVSKGLIVVAADEWQLAPVLGHLDRSLRQELSLSWPGANTWLVDNHGVFPRWITGDSNEVAVRVTAAPALAALCRAVGGPLVSTSANPAGADPAKSAFQVVRYFGPDLPRAASAVNRNAGPSTIRRAKTGEVIRA